jgi:hypothetical protein
MDEQTVQLGERGRKKKERKPPHILSDSLPIRDSQSKGRLLVGFSSGLNLISGVILDVWLEMFFKFLRGDLGREYRACPYIWFQCVNNLKLCAPERKVVGYVFSFQTVYSLSVSNF